MGLHGVAGFHGVPWCTAENSTEYSMGFHGLPWLHSTANSVETPWNFEIYIYVIFAESFNISTILDLRGKPDCRRSVAQRGHVHTLNL